MYNRNTQYVFQTQGEDGDSMARFPVTLRRVTAPAAILHAALRPRRWPHDWFLSPQRWRLLPQPLLRGCPCDGLPPKECSRKRVCWSRRKSRRARGFPPAAFHSPGQQARVSATWDKPRHPVSPARPPDPGHGEETARPTLPSRDQQAKPQAREQNKCLFKPLRWGVVCYTAFL